MAQSASNRNGGFKAVHPGIITGLKMKAAPAIGYSGWACTGTGNRNGFCMDILSESKIEKKI
jgi:hypothetical protein